MAAEFDIGIQMQKVFLSAFKILPWYFWLFIVLGIVGRILPPPSKQRKHRKVRGVAISSEFELNKNLMPCPDCKGRVSINALSCPHCGAPISASYVKDFKAKQAKSEREFGNQALSFMIRFASFAVVVLIGICLWLAIRYTSGLLMWLLTVPLGIFLLVGLFDWVTLSNKGKFGEQLVKTILSRGLNPKEYKVINDVFLPIDEGGTTQIDHIVVSVYGIFVIETKNYSGLIFADNYSQKWTQVLPGKKNQFQNPIRQNYLHVKAISNNLGIPEEFIHGIVAFSDKAEFKGEKPNGVVFFMQIPQAIKEKNKVILRKEEADDIVGAIREWNDSVTPEQRRNHVKNIHNRIAQKCS